MSNLFKNQNFQEAIDTVQDIMSSQLMAGWDSIAAMYYKDIRTIEILDKNRVKVVMVINGNPFEFIYARGI